MKGNKTQSTKKRSKTPINPQKIENNQSDPPSTKRAKSERVKKSG